MNHRTIGRIAMLLVLMIAGSSPSVFSGRVDYCKIFGSVYVEKNAKIADYRVFEEESEAFCNIRVFEVDNRLYADKAGLWHFTDKKEFADFSIYFEPKRGLADFTIFFIDVESFAGCNN